MTTKRPSFFRRKYIVNKKLQFRIALIMILEVALISIAMSTIIICLNDYYQNLINYFLEGSENQISLSDINKPVWFFMTGSVAFSSIVFAVVGIYLSHKIAGPLFRLKKHMLELSKGVYSGKIKFRKGDQLHDMADTYNEMFDSLIEQNNVNKSNIDEIDQIVSDLTKSFSDNKKPIDNKAVTNKLKDISKLVKTL